MTTTMNLTGAATALLPAYMLQTLGVAALDLRRPCCRTSNGAGPVYAEIVEEEDMQVVLLLTATLRSSDVHCLTSGPVSAGVLSHTAAGTADLAASEVHDR